MFNRFAPIILLLALVSCRTLRVERPPEAYNEPDVTAQYSNINIPIEIGVETLEKLINKRLPNVLYNDTSFEDNNRDDLMLRAWKRDDIKIRIDGNMLYYQVPVEVWVKKRFRMGFFGSDTREMTGAILLKYKTRIALNPDWSISYTTLPDGYEWIRTPQIKLGPVEVPLPYISDLILNANQSDITREIDNSLKSSYNLLASVKEIWTGMQKPFSISDDPPLWVKVTPAEIRTIPLQASAGRIRQIIGIRALVQLYWGEEPSDTINDSVPNLKITSRLDDSFIINGMIGVPIIKANELVSQELKGYRMTQGTYVITVRDAALYGSNGNLIIALNVAGDLDGTIYLAGKPYFDKETRSIKVENLDFDIRTKNVLIRSASWIFHQGLINAIQSKLELPVGDQLEQTRSKVASYLEKGQQLDMFKLNGAVDELTIGNIQITRSSLNAVFKLAGKVKVSIE